ncbi:unnamed protein product [Hermetia illucens]|uniref:Uncharacterized protein n=1 Tax=Hermetia illucens TaxID=343691 RepID=A0A7R8V2J1_HERIL|nr:unnamed protein product [Hermetia illucens]
MSVCSCISTTCVVIVILQIIKTLVPWLYKNLLGPKFFGPKIDVRRMGQWAVITGATDGIGKAYAKALAKKGVNVVLISRSKDKLEKVAEEIKSASSAQVKIIDVDFTQGPEIYDKIEKGIAGLEVGTLVNNVGMSYANPEFFLSIQDRDKLLRDIIECNIHSVTHMCKLVMPGMVERKKGVIINISSLSAVVPSPLLSVYGATKAFVDKFSVDLNTEYSSQGIIVQSVLPGYVATNMSKIRKETFLAPNSDNYVASALTTLVALKFYGPKLNPLYHSEILSRCVLPDICGRDNLLRLVPHETVEATTRIA